MRVEKTFIRAHRLELFDARQVFGWAEIWNNEDLETLYLQIWFYERLKHIRVDAYNGLSYDVASGSEITPCNKICKPLVVYRFSGNVITSITTLHT